MKKKIVFMIINMNIGGTEKALLNMISELPRDQFEITVLMLEEYGGFMGSIPSDVHVEYLDDYKDVKQILNHPPIKTALGMLKKQQFIEGFKIAALHLISKIRMNRSMFYKHVLKDIPEIQDEYDIAVAYAGPMDLISYFIANKVVAKKKVQWIHFDIDEIGFNKHFAREIYRKFDKIFVVSKEGRNRLVNRLPSLSNKTEVLYNLISPQLIKEKAISGNGFEDDFNGIRILTVGRLADVKGQDMAIKALFRLVQNGFNVRWYCVGAGNAQEEYEEMVTTLNLKSKFIFLGEDVNPYRYIKDCNIYVQPSRHEGYCITLAEARTLNKPIITTDFTGAKEQITHKETGLIVDIHEDGIYSAVKELIENPELGEMFSMNLSKETTKNTDEMEKIYNLV